MRPGPTADVYSLALTLYEGLTGEHPLDRRGARGDSARHRRARAAPGRGAP